MKIVLLGYMASGKSAVGKVLALKLNMQFVDLDDFIEAKENMSISNIFDIKGEIYFRKIEGEYLQELLNVNEDMIISLGGGTPCYGKNMEIISKKSVSFYLKASINTIFNRLQFETSKRPLVAAVGVNNLKEYIGKHLFERNLFYDKANFLVSVNEKDVQEITEEILKLL